eukprot:710554-Rhodomonas_salina.3
MRARATIQQTDARNGIWNKQVAGRACAGEGASRSTRTARPGAEATSSVHEPGEEEAAAREASVGGAGQREVSPMQEDLKTAHMC